MSQYDPKFDTKLISVTVTYISCSSDFALYLEEYLIYKHNTYGLRVSTTRNWSDFTLTLTSSFPMKVITWVPFMLG